MHVSMEPRCRTIDASMADWDSLERLRARQAEFEAFDERIKELQGDLGHSWLAVFVAGAAAVLIVVLLVWLWSATRGNKAAQEHPMLAKIAYKKLAPGSMTRLAVTAGHHGLRA